MCRYKFATNYPSALPVYHQLLHRYRRIRRYTRAALSSAWAAQVSCARSACYSSNPISYLNSCRRPFPPEVPHCRRALLFAKGLHSSCPLSQTAAVHVLSDPCAALSHSPESLPLRRPLHRSLPFPFASPSPPLHRSFPTATPFPSQILPALLGFVRLLIDFLLYCLSHSPNQIVISLKWGFDHQACIPWSLDSSYG